jgi:hypothetical protein
MHKFQTLYQSGSPLISKGSGLYYCNYSQCCLGNGGGGKGRGEGREGGELAFCSLFAYTLPHVDNLHNSQQKQQILTESKIN